MEISEQKQADSITLRISGEIDGSNVNDFKDRIMDASGRTEMLVVDLKGLDYISSSGLRIFLAVQKFMKQQGHKLILKNMADEVMDIFTVTGFVKLFDIQRES